MSTCTPELVLAQRKDIFLAQPSIHLINDHTVTQVGNKEDDALAESDAKDSSRFEGS